MALETKFTEKIASLTKEGAISGADALKQFSNVMNAIFENDWIQGGVIVFPKKEDIINAYIVEPLRNADGTERLNKRNEVIYQKYLLVSQEGEPVKLSFGALQRRVKLYTKDGDSLKDAKGNFITKESNGSVVDDFKAVNGDVAKFLDKVAGQTANVTINRVYTFNNFNKAVEEVGVLTINYVA